MNDSLDTQPENNPEVLEAFLLDNSTAVQKLISHIYDEETELYVHIHPDQGMFISEIVGLHISPTSPGQIWIARPFEKSAIRNLTENTAYTVVAFPEGVKVQFSGVGLKLATYQNAQVLRLPLPSQAVRVQRRNFFRVIADAELMTHIRLNDPQLKGEFELMDLSIAGCSISLQGKPENFEKDATIEDAELVLPDSSPTIGVRLRVRNITVNPENSQHVCLGCEMKLKRAQDFEKLQRRLLATERRQRVKQII